MGRLSRIGPEQIYVRRIRSIQIEYFIQNNNNCHREKSVNANQISLIQIIDKIYFIKKITLFLEFTLYKILGMKAIILMKMFVLISIFLHGVQTQSEITIQVTQGYDIYSPLSNYFSTYQKITLSDLIGDSNSREYHFCYMETVENARTKQLTTAQIVQNKNTTLEHVIYDLNQILQTDQIIASIYCFQKRYLYVLTKDQVKIYEIQKEGLIKQFYKAKLAEKVKKGKFTEYQQKVYLFTQKILFLITIQNSQIKLQQVLSLSQQNDQINWVMTESNWIYVASKNALTTYNIQNLDQKNASPHPLNVKTFDKSSQDSFILIDKANKLMFYSQDRGIFISFEIDLSSNSSINISQFYKLPLSRKCHKVQKWQGYFFFECENHFFYADLQQIVKCNHSSRDNMAQCMDKLKMGHLNIGYHIQSFQFVGNSTIILAGINQYQILSMVTETQDQKLLIREIKRAQTYLAVKKIEHVYFSQISQALVLTKDQLIINKNIQAKTQISCKTTEESKNRNSDHPSGIFNGTVAIEGICSDIKNNYQKNRIGTSNVCKVQIPLSVNILAMTSRYEFIWYILTGLILAFCLFNVLYFWVKRRNISREYKKFQDQKQYGQNVVQQTMVTQTNQQSFGN